MHDEEASMAEFIAATSDEVRAYIGAMGMPLDVVDDVAQEAYLRYLSQPERRPAAVPMIAWLKGIARHCVHEHLRRTPRGGQRLAELAAELESAAPSSIEEDAAQALPALRACLAELPQRHRDMLQLTYAEGLVGKELAERLGTTLGTVQVTLHRLRCVVRDCIRRRLVAT